MRLAIVLFITIRPSSQLLSRIRLAHSRMVSKNVARYFSGTDQRTIPCSASADLSYAKDGHRPNGTELLYGQAHLRLNPFDGSPQIPDASWTDAASAPHILQDPPRPGSDTGRGSRG